MGVNSLPKTVTPDGGLYRGLTVPLNLPPRVADGLELIRKRVVA